MKYLVFLITIFLFLNPSSGFAQSPYPNVKISAEDGPNEVCIAINPLDVNNIVAAANIDAYYYSFDGGLTWAVRKLTSNLGVWGDPCVVPDTKGNFYYFHLANSIDSKIWLDRIVCQKSTDGGISWSQPGTYMGINAPHLQDKEWAAVDLTYSFYRNNIYVAWTQCPHTEFFDEPASTYPPNDSGSNIIFSYSTNEGETWSKRTRLNKTPGSMCFNAENTVLGAIPCVGANGEVYVAWVSPKGIFLDKSTNGGASWLDNDIKAVDLPGSFKFHVPGIYRVFGFPSMASDFSFGPFDGTVYISWADQRNGTDNTDIWIIKSVDAGISWSKPLKVNDDTGRRHQFFNWMTIDQSTGYIYIVFYDRRNYVDNRTDVYLARSTDGGNTFTNERISKSPFSPSEITFMGDYTGISAVDGVIRPIWTRLDENELSVWSAIINEQR